MHRWHLCMNTVSKEKYKETKLLYKNQSTSQSFGGIYDCYKFSVLHRCMNCLKKTIKIKKTKNKTKKKKKKKNTNKKIIKQNFSKTLPALVSYFYFFGEGFSFFFFSDQGQSSLHSHSLNLNLADVRNSRIVLKVLAMCLYV